MTTITLSSKFQIVIPRDVRETMDLASGTRLIVIPYENRIELIPLKPLKELRGMLRGIDTSITREKDRI